MTGHDRSAWSGLRGRRSGICFAVLAAFLATSTPASAARLPTHGERVAITRAAMAADGSPTQRVRVRDIRVSTAGRWATATVAVYFKRDKKPEMVSEDTFFFAHDRWWDTTNPSAPGRTPPPAVVSDLGLPGGGHSDVGQIIAYVIVGLLILGLLALLRKAARALGLSSAGGGGAMAPGGPSTRLQTMSSSRVSSGPAAPNHQPHWQCNGTGRVQCSGCGGSGQISNTTSTGTHYSTHSACGGRGELQCLGCGGTGKVRA